MALYQCPGAERNHHTPEQNAHGQGAGRAIHMPTQPLASGKGAEHHGCQVHVPDNIDVKVIREMR